MPLTSSSAAVPEIESNCSDSSPKRVLRLVPWLERQVSGSLDSKPQPNICSMIRPTLPDKLQILALTRPHALAIVEELIDGLLKHVDAAAYRHPED